MKKRLVLLTIVAFAAITTSGQSIDGSTNSISLTNLIGRWTFDDNRFDELFERTIDAQVKELGVKRPSQAELDRRKASVQKNRPNNVVSDYRFSFWDTNNAVLLEFNPAANTSSSRKQTLTVTSIENKTVHLKDDSGAPVDVEFLAADRIWFYKANKLASGKTVTTSVPFRKR